MWLAICTYLWNTDLFSLVPLAIWPCPLQYKGSKPTCLSLRKNTIPTTNARARYATRVFPLLIYVAHVLIVTSSFWSLIDLSYMLKLYRLIVLLWSSDLLPPPTLLGILGSIVSINPPPIGGYYSWYIPLLWVQSPFVGLVGWILWHFRLHP